MTPPHRSLEEPGMEDEFICKWEDVSCLADYFRAALRGDESKASLRRLWDQQVGIIHSRPAPQPPASPALAELLMKWCDDDKPVTDVMITRSNTWWYRRFKEAIEAAIRAQQEQPK